MEDHKEEAKQPEAAGFKVALNANKKVSDHLPRKAGKNKVIWNIMTQEGPNDMYSGGLLTAGPDGKPILETEGQYRERLFDRVAPAIAATVTNDPGVEFILLQEAPEVKTGESGLGKDFIKETIDKLNEGKQPPEKWDCVHSYDETLTKCIFYRCDKYSPSTVLSKQLNEAAQQSHIDNAGNDIKLREKECFAQVFQEKKNDGDYHYHAVFNIHLEPGQGAGQKHIIEKQMKMLSDEAQQQLNISLESVFVGGDCNFNTGIGSSALMLAETSVNTYTDVMKTENSKVAEQKYVNVDAGYEQVFYDAQGDAIENPPIQRSQETILDFTGKPLPIPQLNSAECVADDSYQPALFSNQPDLSVNAESLQRHLQSLPASGEPKPIVTVNVEVNNYNSSRVAIESTRPIKYYEDLIKNNTEGVTVERGPGGLKYCLQLNGDKPVFPSAYDPKKITFSENENVTNKDVIQDHIEKYDKKIKKYGEKLVEAQTREQEYRELCSAKKASQLKELVAAEIKVRFPDNFQEKLEEYSNLERDQAEYETVKGGMRGKVTSDLLATEFGYKKLDQEEKELNTQRLALKREKKLSFDEETKMLEEGDGKRAAMRAILDGELAVRMKPYEDRKKERDVLKNIKEQAEAKRNSDPTFQAVDKEEERVRNENSQTVSNCQTDLKYARKFQERLADQLMPEYQSVCTIIKELEEYQTYLKATRSKSHPDQPTAKEGHVQQLIDHLNKNDMSSSEKLDSFTQGDNENHLKALQARRDPGWVKAAKGIAIALLVVGTLATGFLAAPIAVKAYQSMWKIKGDEVVKNIKKELPDDNKNDNDNMQQEQRRPSFH